MASSSGPVSQYASVIRSTTGLRSPAKRSMNSVMQTTNPPVDA